MTNSDNLNDRTNQKICGSSYSSALSKKGSGRFVKKLAIISRVYGIIMIISIRILNRRVLPWKKK